SPEKNERLHQHFINLQLKATICKSSRINVEINADDVSKGNAIAFLSEKLGININQVATVGDEENDISMLSLTSNSFTLSSSNEKVRSSAAYVLNSKPSYLVKEVIEKVVFNK
ncbi:MAG: HAD hydrolase family protein, partial [Mycoplasmoidaceae bacterium]|nr:HAD hydrolase family protein [Mycoplasmoidaceae bacterium]